MQQETLWHDSIEDSLKSIVDAAGGPKSVGSTLWPSKKILDAARLLNHCLDPERPEKLSLDEVLLIARIGKERGVHTFMSFLANELGYTTPTPVTPEDEMTELLRQNNELTKALIKSNERLARVSVKAVG